MFHLLSDYYVSCFHNLNERKNSEGCKKMHCFVTSHDLFSHFYAYESNQALEMVIPYLMIHHNGVTRCTSETCISRKGVQKQQLCGASEFALWDCEI